MYVTVRESGMCVIGFLMNAADVSKQLLCRGEIYFVDCLDLHAVKKARQEREAGVRRQNM